MSVFGSYYKYIFLFFTLKFQISKKIVFEIWNILYENYKEKLLWFNAFFAKFVKIYTHKLFDFLTFFQFNSRNNFLDSKKLFLRTLFFSMKHCLQNFSSLLISWTFFWAWYYIFDHSRMFVLAETHSGDTISESHLPAFCESFSFQKFVSRMFLLLWYWILSCLFEYCFSLNNLVERFCF